MADNKTISILDVDFSVSMPYNVGHVCNEAEAKVLNQTRRENIGNNFRPEVKKYQDQAEGALSLDELQAAFAELDANYIFTLANAGAASRKLDPVEREARSIAREMLKQALSDAGLKYKEPPEGKTQQEWDDFIETKLDEISAMEDVVKTATKTVKARQGAASITLGDLGLGGAPASA